MKRTKTRAGAIAAIGTALLMAVAGCGTTAGTPSSNGPAPAKGAKDVTIGFLHRQIDAPYYAAMQAQAQAFAKKNGFKLVFQNAASDPVTQINQAQTMLSQNVDAIVVNAVDPKTEATQMKAIADQKPLIFLDTAIPDVGITAVSSDNAAIGKDSGQLAAKRFKSGQTINLAILNGGPADVNVGPARQQGFLDGLKSGGVNYKIVSSQPALYSQDKAVPVTQSILAANKNVDLIFGYNDAMALGALTVLQDQKNTKTLVAGVDGQKQAFEQIKKGCSAQYVSTGLNSPSVATDRAFGIALSLATGKSKAADYQKNEYTKAAGINCDNVDQFYKADSVF